MLVHILGDYPVAMEWTTAGQLGKTLDIDRNQREPGDRDLLSSR